METSAVEPGASSAGGGDSPVLDAAQLQRIESVHRGFLYQHLFAVGCLLSLSDLNAEAVIVEHDEDVELVRPAGRVYVQVKTRARPLQWNDLREALERFAELRAAHVSGQRPGVAVFVVASSVAPGPQLLERISGPSWPQDVILRWPGGSDHSDLAALPPAWRDLAEAMEWCAGKAATLALSALSAETLVLKLAGIVQYASTGNHDHRFVAEDLSGLFEFFTAQLQDFPEPPRRYRPQAHEPELISAERLRIVTGFSGSGKTSWAARAATRTTDPMVYFDVSDLQGSLIAASLGRELAAKFLPREAGASSLPASSGLELLRAVDARLAGQAAVTVVLDNVHLITANELRQLVDATSMLRFVLIGQPWDGQATLQAWFGVQAEAMHGWALDEVVAEFAATGCPVDAATGEKIRAMTGGLPLFVVRAADLAGRSYGGDAVQMVATIANQTHAQATAQEVILAEVLDAVPSSSRRLAALLCLVRVPLAAEEVLGLSADEPSLRPITAQAIRDLTSRGVLQ